MKLKSDKRLNPALATEVQSLRSVMVEQAEKNALPARFEVTRSKTMPRMRITDKVSGKTTEVPLFAYGEVIEVLIALLGDS